MDVNLILLLVGLWSRPECPPVTEADVKAVAVHEATLAVAAAVRPFVADGEAVPGRLVVGYEPDRRQAVIGALAGMGARLLRDDREAGFMVVELDSDRAAEPGRVPGVRFVEPDCRVQASLIPNDPLFLQYQWDKWVMYADRAWDIGTGAGVKVAVVDNGVEYWHPDLAASFVAGDYGYDFVGGDNDPRPDNPAIPEAFHGTHVAGTIAAGINNGIGVAGWGRAQLYAVRVLNDSGSGTTTDVASGIRWATDHGARVVNMSLGSSSLPTHLLEACRYAYDRNVLLVAAAGNEGNPNVNYPAALAECVCVGATDTASKLAWFSNYGTAQEVVAPGVAVFATGTGGTYVSANGTSMATPQVSGVAALLLGLNNSLSASRVRAVLAASAMDMGNSGRDVYYGYGLVNARRAMELAQVVLRRESDKGRTRICRGRIAIPAGAVEAVVCDATGRMLHQLRPKTATELRVGPGTYFLLLRAADGAAESRKILVLD